MDQNGHFSKKRDFKARTRKQSDWLSDLNDVGPVELIENDQRPTFLLDIDSHGSFGATDARLVYSNDSLKNIPDLLEQVQSLYNPVEGNHDPASTIFAQWAVKPATSHPTRSGSSCKSFLRFIWTIVTVRHRWNIVSGMSIDAIDDLQNDDSNATYSSSPKPKYLDGVAKSSDSEKKVGKQLDWTLLGSCFETTSHIEWVRNFDWGSTPLGDMRAWSDQLRLTVNMAMSDPSPVAMYWGQDMTLIYNEAFIPIFRTKHPWSLGRTFAEVYVDVAIDFKDFYDSLWGNGLERGRATAADDERYVMVTHNARLEEVFFSYTVLPVLGGSGCVEGFYVAFKDVTRTVVATRRASALRAAADANANAKDPEALWRNLVEAVSSNENDMVSIFAYSTRSLWRGASNPSAKATAASVLEAFSTVPVDDRGVPCAHDLFRKDVHFMAAFYEALRTGMPQKYDMNDATLAQALMDPAKPLKNRDLPRELALCPTDPHLSSQGILVLAINPFRPYDVDYEAFVANVAREMSTSLAVSDRAQFAEQAIVESELRFSQMTATSPAAHFEVNLEGQILYVNDRWHSITGMPRPGHEIPAMSWLQLVYEPDIPVIEREWAHLQEGKPVSFEIRLKKNWQAINPFSGETLELEHTWVLAMASQHATKIGPTIMGCLVDINRQKWAEDFHKRKTEEAIEMKHQQERFIDMTSHEMRNPLSAIFQCSDSIISTLEEAMKETANGDANKAISRSAGSNLSESFKSCIEAAQTISLCAQHQKRIADDVLMLSKMDANMIEVTPMDSNPKQLLESGLSIFASELRANDTHMVFHIDQSYKNLGVDWVRLDPSRLLQILINLTTNALKFTIPEMDERRIIVSLGASTAPPLHLSSDDARFTYLPRSGDIIDPTSRPEWGSGAPIYIHVSVQDTGRGISENELKELFMRFKQASPRTHVQYGGSGLGLHIARQLTEMQAGQIGVTSERGKGSTFSFYIKAKRCNPTDIPLPAPRASSGTLTRQVGSTKALNLAAQQSRSYPTSRESTPVREPRKVNVLIVEDNLVNQRVLSKQLQNLGWNVSVANHGLEALEALKETVFWAPTSSSGRSKPLDLVLMDIEMPIMDGLSATKEIRKLQAEGTINGHVPIMAVSANARSEQIAKATAAGIVGYIV